jgi:hypothetical protein
LKLVYGGPGVDRTEGEKSQTCVKCVNCRKSNIKILMTIYGLMGSYWFILMGSCEKFRSFKFCHGFWIEVIRIFMMADFVSQKRVRVLFFCENVSFYCIFSILTLKLRILDYGIDEILWPLFHTERQLPVY